MRKALAEIRQLVLAFASFFRFLSEFTCCLLTLYWLGMRVLGHDEAKDYDAARGLMMMGGFYFASKMLVILLEPNREKRAFSNPVEDLLDDWLGRRKIPDDPPGTVREWGE